MKDEQAADWRSWRIELTAHGKYVELSFDGVRLTNEADIQRWFLELEVALGHYRRPVDMLIDLRGVEVGESIGPRCGERLGKLLERHAASLSYFGADPLTEVALGPPLATHGGGRGGPERATALSWLMERRRRRRAAHSREVATSHLPGVPTRRAPWEESGAIPV